MRRSFKSTVLMTVVVMFLFTIAFSNQVMARRKPDLTIVKITVDRSCNLAVIVKNNGPGALPNYVYTKHHPKSAGVFVYINGKSWGGESIWKFDPARKLQKSGGQATCILNYKVGPPIDVKAVVDLWNNVKEANERNNAQTRKRLSCRPSGGKRLPDLVVKDIRLIKNCKIQVTIANIGTAGVPSSYYDNPNAVAVQMYKGSQAWGGMILKMFDPAGKLKSPGGVATHVWFPAAANLNLSPGTHSLKVIVDVHKKLTELSETNNSLTRRVTCRKGLPDLVVKDIRLIKDCKIQVTIANIGGAGVPDSYYDLPDAVAVQMYKGTQAWGGMILKMFDPARNLKAPGGVATHVWFPLAANLNLSPGTHSIKVIVDVHKKLTELDETNNSLTRRVTCRKPVSAIGTQIATATTPPVLAIKPPKTLMLDFTDAYLVFSNPYKSIQIAAQSTVLSYGSDWEKCQLKPYLYHIRQKFWQGFFWQINTSRKEVYEVTGGTFCKISPGTHKKLNIKVDVVGGSSTTPPDRFFLRFSEARLVYQVSSKTLQLATGNKVLSYCQDFQKCNLTASVYHFKETFWKGFYWKVNTLQKKVWKVNGTFCQSSTGGTLLSIGVRVFN